MTVTKQKIIDEIVIEIESGKSYSETFGVIRSKSKLAESTFASYWKIANEQYKVVQDKRRAITESKATQAHIEAVETAIMSRKEKLRILEEIATGVASFEKLLVIQGVVQREFVTPDATDRMKAIEIHNKMQGDNATEKTDVTTGGEKISNVHEVIFKDFSKDV